MKQHDIVAGLTIGAFVLMGLLVLVSQIDADIERRKHAPCDSFSHREIQYVPARCVRFFAE